MTRELTRLRNTPEWCEAGDILREIAAGTEVAQETSWDAHARLIIADALWTVRKRAAERRRRRRAR